jgi:hypothetical protein
MGLGGIERENLFILVKQKQISSAEKLNYKRKIFPAIADSEPEYTF